MRGHVNTAVKKSNANTLRAMKEDPAHKIHGTVRGYRLGCKCTKCQSREVYEEIGRQREQLRERAKTDDTDLSPHGTNTRYLYGCRCDNCKEAHRIHNHNYDY